MVDVVLVDSVLVDSCCLVVDFVSVERTDEPEEVLDDALEEDELLPELAETLPVLLEEVLVDEELEDEPELEDSRELPDEALLPEDWEAAEDLETLEEDVEPD